MTRDCPRDRRENADNSQSRPAPLGDDDREAEEQRWQEYESDGDACVVLGYPGRAIEAIGIG